ncbi:sensor histidine kinase [Sulfitobacter sp. JB4-11]|uniref:sensor histidine kinase n=1 Tax=Sulfitobacter rhodophyticola TaxID=3238304 RepID=UPI0035175047
MSDADTQDNPKRKVLSFSRARKRQTMMRLVLFTALAAIMVVVAHKIENLTYQNYVRDAKLTATVRMIEVRERMQSELFDRIMDLNDLSAQIGQKPDLNRTEFNLKAVDYILNNPEVRSVVAAPNQIATMVFPRSEEEGIMGTDYRVNSAYYRKLEAALRADEGLINGPVNLATGGRGLILSRAVYDNSSPGPGHPWGMISIVLDYDKLMNKVGFPEFETKFNMLISEVEAVWPYSQQVMFGDIAVLDQNPIRLSLNLPFGQWQLAATPEGGWPRHRPNHLPRWFMIYAAMGISLLSLWYVMRLFDTRRRAERQLSVGIEALDHGFVMFDADRRLVAFNNKYKQLAGGSGMVRLGARYEDIVKANLRKKLIPDAIGREEEWYEEWSKRLHDKSSDKEQILADGRLIRAYDRPMDDGSVVGLRIDITDLKKAQMAAEAANKAKTDFMGVLSHELRTPLTVILGHAKLARNVRAMPVYRKLISEIEAHPEARDDILPKLDAMNNQIATMMESLERSGNHLFTLISEILDFAKVDSGTLSMDMVDTDAARIAQPVIDQMRPMVEEKGLTLSAHVNEFALVADDKRIQQVLINLIGNASKFTDKGTITLDISETDENVLFRVSDTGIGIPEEHLGRVFEAFHQVDNSSGRKYGGTGLGLAISRDIAQAHGGDLIATSAPGQGSTFILSLPRPEAETEGDTKDTPVRAMVA